MSVKKAKKIFISIIFVSAAITFGVIYGAKALNIKEEKEVEFEINLSREELEKRTNKEYLIDINLLGEESKEYKKLQDGDKKALKHLVKAAQILEEIQLQLDNSDNIAFREYIIKQAKGGNEDALKTLILFNAQRGMNGIDREAKHIELAKNHHELAGKGFYPSDLSMEEFHAILISMLNQGQTDMVKKILNQRSVVERNGYGLIAIDYTDKFKEEFMEIADELEAAADLSTDTNFNEYLRLQAKALRTANPLLDAYADKKWATLQDTPLEFTITRENYNDQMTKTISSNEQLSNLLAKYGIKPIAKDSLGCRVGIVNKTGTEEILKIKKFLPKMAEMMPLKELYNQSINTEEEAKQTMVDVDLVSMTGDCGAYRGGITIAENLPNNDKLSLTIGGGRRNVYHRQVRNMFTAERNKKKAEAILDPTLHKYYNNEAQHLFTIGHENTHSLGPNSGTERLGKYQSIIEENKADMGSLSFLDMLVKEGLYTNEQKKQIIVSSIVSNYLKAKPTMSQAHRVRSVMQIHYLTKEGAITYNKDGKIVINTDKAVPAAQKMLKEIIEIQLSGDINKAEEFVKDNFVWDKNCEETAEKLRAVDKELNGQTIAPLAKKLLEG